MYVHPNHRPIITIARLLTINNVLYINSSNEPPNQSYYERTVAPGVAKIPQTTSAQRWHERLGHSGQKVLKQTAQNSLGLEELDLSKLSICEICHLNKAQRFISREPRPTPGKPLDEISVDTVGKLPTSLNGYQYAVIITDAKTRMRWALTTCTKDEIAPCLVKWIETQQH